MPSFKTLQRWRRLIPKEQLARAHELRESGVPTKEVAHELSFYCYRELDKILDYAIEEGLQVLYEDDLNLSSKVYTCLLEHENQTMEDLLSRFSCSRAQMHSALTNLVATGRVTKKVVATTYRPVRKDMRDSDQAIIGLEGGV